MCKDDKITILNAEPEEYERINKIRIAVCVALSVCVLIVNIICAVFLNEGNKIALLTVNISSDIVCGCFLIWFITEKIIPRVKLLRLAKSPSEAFSGTVEKISDGTIRYLDFDCRQVYIGGKVFYRIDGGVITFEVGDEVKINSVSGIAVAVERAEYE